VDNNATNRPAARPTTAGWQFTTTHWSVVLEAARPESPGAVDAFAALYRDYWYPLYAYVRRRGRSPHEAEDLTQDFFVALLKRERLRGLERGGGRFRSFLLKALQNFLANEWDRATAQKRGSGCPVIPLDEVDAESRFLADPAGVAPEADFERNWAFAVIALAMRNLELELRAAGRERLFEHLGPHLQGDHGARKYAAIGAELGMSEGAVKVAVHRLKQRYGELLRAELARTVGREEDLESELRHLIEVVSG
jgi:RNA polymerase sigma-70 factor (ECF subfamily)